MKRRHVKIVHEPGTDEMAVHIAADPLVLAELSNIILIECQKKEIPYVQQTADV
jgi:hypothetical protein